ncbi:HAMP domain-containing sensor histidine kinase [Lachnospiraceae bacterium 66-29]
MFKKLHIRLTIFCTFICSIILILMSLICLPFLEKESRESHFSDFQSNSNMLIRYLESQTVISRSWLVQFYTDTQLEIDIRDNGSKLVLQNLLPVSVDEDTFTQARQKAQEDFQITEDTFSANSVFSLHAEYEFSKDGQNYYASTALIPKNNGILNVTVVLPLKNLEQGIRQRRLLFASANIFGILLLGIFFWLFTWHMIKPLIISHQKQTEFIASASHELRSPLTVMLSSLSAMKHAAPEEAEHFSEMITLEGKRMSRLINDMLTLSGTDSSHFTIQKTDVELDTLLLSAYEKFESLAREKEISLHISLPDALIPPCPCDQGRMEQVLSILIDNALSYTPSGGKISLSLQSSSNQLMLRVADTGMGISDSEKKAVFDRFYRCDKSHKDKNHFGLGLCIAQEIIHLHKGRLWVEDTPGGGATFVIVLGL